MSKFFYMVLPSLLFSGLSAYSTDCQDLQNGSGYIEAAHYNPATGKLKLFLPDDGVAAVGCNIVKGTKSPDSKGAIRYEASCPVGSKDSFVVEISFAAQKGEESLGVCRILGLTPN